jgi:hypothetical protein
LFASQVDTTDLNIRTDTHKFDCMHRDGTAKAIKPGHTCLFHELFKDLDITRLNKSLAGARSVNMEIKQIADGILADMKRAFEKVNEDRVVVSDCLANVMVASRARKKARIIGEPAPLMLMPPATGGGGVDRPLATRSPASSSAGVTDTGGPSSASVLSPVVMSPAVLSPAELSRVAETTEASCEENDDRVAVADEILGEKLQEDVAVGAGGTADAGEVARD